ncbi:MAG: glycosyltransferase family 4 protein [Planctomycetota bacterium]
MRVLFVATPNSVHTARWIGQFADLGWDLHVFPSAEFALHPQIGPLRYHPPLGSRSARHNRHVRQPLPTLLAGPWLRRARRLWPSLFEEAKRLAAVIAKVQPDVVHSMEMQQAGYLSAEAMPLVPGPRPPWLVTNWGSDIYFFGRMAEHRGRIEHVLRHCDYYDCECERDQQLARDFGYDGPMFPVTPNAGGFDLKRCARLRQPGPTSARKMILVKGYQSWSGRAVTALRAIELAADALRGYEVGVYLANEDVELVAEAVGGSTGLPIKILPKLPHEEMLRRHGSARMSIGVSATDGLSTSFLEALVMGAFPIQSHHAAAAEWIEDGKSGLIIDPDDPGRLAEAIRRVATDDELVDSAAAINDETCRRRLAADVVREQAIAMYQAIADDSVNTKTRPADLESPRQHNAA